MEHLLARTDEISQLIRQFSQESDEDKQDVELHRLRARVRELQMALYSPREALFLGSHYVARASAVRALLRLGVVDALVDAKSMTAAELAKQVRYDNPELIARLLRTLLTEGIVRSEDGIIFSSTPYLEAYLAQCGDRWMNRYNEIVPAMTTLTEYLMSHEPRDILDPKHTVHSWVNGQEGRSIFGIVKQNPHRARVFSSGMVANEGNKIPAFGIFPWERLLEGDTDKERPLLVDVGGGLLRQSETVLEAYPAFSGRVIVQDIEHIIESTSEHQLAGVQYMSYNYHDPQPVKGAKAYYFVRIIHTLQDDQACNLLQTTLAAMAPDSRILIAEQLMPEIPSTAELEDVAVEDYIMLMIGGKERTAREFQLLLDRAGLELAHIWKSPCSYQCIVEARLRGN